MTLYDSILGSDINLDANDENTLILPFNDLAAQPFYPRENHSINGVVSSLYDDVYFVFKLNIAGNCIMVEARIIKLTGYEVE